MMTDLAEMQFEILPYAEAAEGVYVFSLAEDARDLVTVSVGYQAGAPFMVFTGSAD